MFVPPPFVHIVSSRNGARQVRYDFVIDDSDLEKVAKSLIGVLEQKVQLFINDHRRNDSEGGLILMRGIGCVQRMTGGHGYSSDWSKISTAQAAAEVASALAATIGGPQHAGGHFEARS
jgi:hypothetical protein